MANDTIFREVDEELRGDRMRTFWRRFGPFIIGGAVAVVLVVAINEGWSWWQSSTAARSSDQFYAALELAERGDAEAAQAALNTVIAEGSGGYPTLARFRQASLLASAGNTAEAVAAYDALATGESNPRLRDMALVLAAYLLIDNGDVAAVRQRVGGLAEPQSPMRNAAREAIGLTHYAAGDRAEALASFEQIVADPQAGQDISNRAQIYIAQLQAMGSGDEAASAAEPAPLDDATEEVPVAEPALPETAAEEPAAEQPTTDVAPAEPVIDAAPPATEPAESEAAAEAPAAEATVPAAEPEPAAEATGN